MPYLVDGHNLIPKITGLSLEAVDDEMELVLLLQEYSRRRRKQVEVYFDNASPGQKPDRTLGTVIAHFTRRGHTADDAIQNRLIRLGRSAKNWVVVSSDQRVQRAAQEAHAQVLSSEEFAREILAGAQGVKPVEHVDRALSAEEVETWLNLFQDRGKGGRKPKE
jgi:predicted RNA-binding protein with PIN domain